MQNLQELVSMWPYLVFSVLMPGGALLHWAQKAKKGEATWNFIDYWFTDSPGYSMGTGAALVLAWWGVISTDALKGAQWHFIVESAVATGWLINSAVSPGSVAVITTAASKTSGFVRLALLPWLIAIAFGLSLLAGCSVLGDLKPMAPIAVPQSLPQAGQEAQKVINEANVALAAAANVIADNTRAGVWDKPTAQHYLDQVKDYAAKVDKAQAYLAGGDYGNAQNQAQIINTLILALSKEVAAKARKEPQ